MRFYVCCFVALLLCGSETAIARRPVLVKDHGDLSRLVVEGNETFTADEIRDALNRIPLLFSLRRRLAAYSEFEQALARLIRDGYLHAGFADVDVTVTFDEERDVIVATIQEGARYKCGGIAVSGVPDELAALICRRLTEPYLAFDEIVAGVHDEETAELLYGLNAAGEPVEPTDAVWSPGKPADFHQQPEERYLEPVTEALRDAGFDGTEVNVKLVPSAEGDVAVLEVNVLDPGVPIVIEDVVVTGAERHSRESVLAFLGLKLPVHWTPELRQRLNQRLWDCGRFQTFSVTLETPQEETSDDGTRLRIDLLEYDGVPLLTEELNEVDQILCRAARWFSAKAGRTSDMVVSARVEDQGQDAVSAGYRQLNAVVSSQRGVVADLQWTRAGQRKPQSYTLVLEPDRCRIASALTDRSFELRFQDPKEFQLQLALTGEQDSDSSNPMSLKYGLHYTSATETGICVQLAAAPMVMLYHARLDNPESTIVDGVLSIRSPYMTAEFEADSGRWISLFLGNLKSVGYDIKVRFEEDAFDRATGQLSESEDDQPILASLPEFIAGELVAFASQGDVEVAESLTALSVSLGARLKHRIDTAPHTEHRREFFQIPWAPVEAAATSQEVIGFGASANALLFPYDSPFGTFGREVLSGLATGDEQTTGNIYELLRAYTSGPLMYWYAAEVFHSLMNLPAIARAISPEGLNRLGRHRFVNDCRQLLTRDDIVRDVIEDCVTSLRELDDSQLHALFAPVVPPEQRTAMIAAIRRDGSSDLDVLLSLLGELWDAKLQDLFRQRLTTLSGGPRIQSANREPAPRDSIRSTALAP